MYAAGINLAVVRMCPKSDYPQLALVVPCYCRAYQPNCSLSTVQVEKFFFFVRGSLPVNKPAFIPCEETLTIICRKPEGCVARFGGRVRMGPEKARRNLAAAGRADQPCRIIPTLSKLFCLMPPALLCGLTPKQLYDVEAQSISISSPCFSAPFDNQKSYSNQKKPLPQQNS